MIFHGSEGAFSGWSHRNAVLLAAHGFLAFPFGYSSGGNAWNAGNIEEVPLDRSLDALAVDYGMARPSEDIEYDVLFLKGKEQNHADFYLGHRHREEQLQRCWGR
jgi:hypothetical protein